MIEPLAVVAAMVDISPDAPCALQGFSSRRGSFSRVADHLELNAIRLNQGDHTVVIYSADVLYLDRDVVAEAETLVRQFRPGAKTHVMAAASHTHFAPAIDASKPLLGARDPHYFEFFKQRLRGLIAALCDRPAATCTIVYRRGESNSSINRRRRGWNFSRQTLLRREAIIAPNPNGYVDRAIRTLEARDASGAVLCVLWNFACHPSNFPLRDCVSADFPGVVRAAIRNHHANPSLPVIYLQGFSGDASPQMSGRLSRTLQGRIFKLLNGRVFGDITPEEFSGWSGELTQQVCRVLHHPPRTLHARLNCSESSVPLSELIEGIQRDRPVRLQRIALSDDVQLIGLGAEVVACYSPMVQNLIKPADLIPVGCVGDCYGYLPSESMLAEGGYEVNGFFKPFSLTGRFRQSVQKRVMDALAQLIAAKGSNESSRIKSSLRSDP